jgi:hypothetical protein
VQPTDGRNTTGQYDPIYHNVDGKTHITLPNQLQKLFDQKCFEAAAELGGNFKYNIDMNSGNPLGIGGCSKHNL